MEVGERVRRQIMPAASAGLGRDDVDYTPDESG